MSDSQWNDKECPVCGEFMTDYDNRWLCEWCGHSQKKDEVYDELTAGKEDSI